MTVAALLLAALLPAFAPVQDFAGKLPPPPPAPPEAPDASDAAAAQAAGEQARSAQAGGDPGTQAAVEGLDELSLLADEGRWDEVHERAARILAERPDDPLALYWDARTEIVRAQPLLSGRLFAQDLAHSMLLRAGEQLAGLTPRPGDATEDAPDWAAYSRYLRGDDETLVADLERWYAQDKHGYAAFLRGLVARQRGEAETLTWLAAACEAEPDRADFLIEWATELGRAGQREQALAAWGRARDAWAPLASLLTSLAEILPDKVHAAERLAALDTLVAGWPEGEEASRRDGLLAWYRAWTLEQLGRSAEAADVFAAATVGRTPDLERAHAQALAELGRTAEAAEHLQQAAAAGDAAALGDLISTADRLAIAHQWDDALALYDAALAIEPHEERAAVNRALTLSQSGRSLDAWPALLAARPGRADLLNDAALQYAGWGRVPEARALLEQAVELPGSLDARQNLADLLLAQEPPDAARARALLESVLAEEPDRDWALQLLLSARRAAPR